MILSDLHPDFKCSSLLFDVEYLRNDTRRYMVTALVMVSQICYGALEIVGSQIYYTADH